jgi:hypothetical protein
MSYNKRRWNANVPQESGYCCVVIIFLGIPFIMHENGGTVISISKAIE